MSERVRERAANRTHRRTRGQTKTQASTQTQLVEGPVPSSVVPVAGDLGHAAARSARNTGGKSGEARRGRGDEERKKKREKTKGDIV